MNNYAYTFIAIAVYLITIAVVYYTLHKRFTDTLTEIETNYRLSLSRACTAFVDAMNARNWMHGKTKITDWRSEAKAWASLVATPERQKLRLTGVYDPYLRG